MAASAGNLPQLMQTIIRHAQGMHVKDDVMHNACNNLLFTFHLMAVAGLLNTLQNFKCQYHGIFRTSKSTFVSSSSGNIRFRRQATRYQRCQVASMW